MSRSVKNKRGLLNMEKKHRPPPCAQTFPISVAVMAGAQRKLCERLVRGPLFGQTLFLKRRAPGWVTRKMASSHRQQMASVSAVEDWVGGPHPSESNTTPEPRVSYKHTHLQYHTSIKTPLKIRRVTIKLSASCFIFTMGSNSTDMQLKTRITTEYRLN